MNPNTQSNTGLPASIARLSATLGRQPRDGKDVFVAWNDVSKALSPAFGTDEALRQAAWKEVVQTKAVPSMVDALRKTLEGASASDEPLSRAVNVAFQSLNNCLFWASPSGTDPDQMSKSLAPALNPILDTVPRLLELWWTTYSEQAPAWVAGGNLAKTTSPQCELAIRIDSGTWGPSDRLNLHGKLPYVFISC